MYSPSRYLVADLNKIYEIIQGHHFATLIVENSDGLVISHLPFMLNLLADTPPFLSAHMARANPQWKQIETARDVTVIFQGPHGYVSPQWYRPDPENVPTWNYVAIHVTGTFKIVSDPENIFTEMKKMVSFFEESNGTNWKLSEPPSKEIQKLLSGITVFQINELKFEAKFKLSQNQIPVNRDEVIRQLLLKKTESSVNLAQIMKSNS